MRVYINGRFLTQHITGVQRYAHELVKTLDLLIDKRKITNVDMILVAPKKGIIHDLKLKNIKLIHRGAFSGHLWEQLDLPRFTRDGLLFCPGNTAPIFRNKKKNPMVVTVHDLSYLYFPHAYSFRFKFLYNLIIPILMKKARIITVSESEKKSILKYFPSVKERITAIQNGGLSIQAEIPKNNNLEKKESEKYALYVGSLSKRKNFQGILKAMEIVNRNINLKLKVAGASGNTFNAGNFVISDMLQEKVELLGQIEDINKLIKLYKNASVFLFPSFYEASPFPPIEAMRLGCPVVASAIPSLQERCGNAALYCNPNSPEDIANKTLFLLNSTKIQKKYSNLGIERAQKYNWEKCAMETFLFIKQSY